MVFLMVIIMLFIVLSVVILCIIMLFIVLSMMVFIFFFMIIMVTLFFKEVKNMISIMMIFMTVSHMSVTVFLCPMTSMMTYSMVVSSMVSSSSMTMFWSSCLHACHECEAQDDSHCSQQTRHPILGQFVSAQHLEECDIEESSSSQTLEQTNDEDMSG